MACLITKGNLQEIQSLVEEIKNNNEVLMQTYENQLINLINQNQIWDRLSGSTILLSGATGMLGKCIVDAIMLRNQIHGSNIKIVAFSRNPENAKIRFTEYIENSCFQYISCDVNEKIPECGNVDYIIHAASNTHPRQYSGDPIGTITANVFGTKNLLDYAVSHGTQRFCFLSSVEIYGENRGDTEKFDESYLGYIDCNTMRAGYPESKRLGEALCNAYGQAQGLDFVISRLSRVYGPTMLLSDSKAISQFIKNAAAGENIILKSEGIQKFSYSFVTDATAGIFYTLVKGASGEVYNIADKESDIILKDLAGILAEAAGVEVVFELPEESERKGYSTATKAMLDASKLENLGWQAQVHMEEGLACTVDKIQKEFQNRGKI